MPLAKGCSHETFKANLRELASSGYEGDQLKAIAVNTLKKACGVPPEEKDLSVKEILARGGALKEARETGSLRPGTRAGAWAVVKLASEGLVGAQALLEALARWPSLSVLKVAREAMERLGLDEEAFGLAGPPKFFTPWRVPKPAPDAPIHRLARSPWRPKNYKTPAGPRSPQGRWVPVKRLAEELPSSPVRGGAIFQVPVGIHGVGTSQAAAPPLERGLLGTGEKPPPAPGHQKCPTCQAVLKSPGRKCPKCGVVFL